MPKKFGIGALLGSAAAGAALLAFVGFNGLGWKGSGAVLNIAMERAVEARIAALAPICADKFRNDSAASLDDLKKINSFWEQGDFVAKGGWATLPGTGPSPFVDVARACAKLLTNPK